LPAEDAELAEIVARSQREQCRSKHRRLAAQDHVERIAAGRGRADALASSKLGERRAADELAQVPPGDLGEQWKLGEQVGPVLLRRAVVVTEYAHHAASCPSRLANGCWNASSARFGATGHATVSGVTVSGAWIGVLLSRASQ